MAVKSTGNLKQIRITVPRGGRFLRRGYGGRVGGPKIARLLPAAWNGQFMRFVRR